MTDGRIQTLEHVNAYVFAGRATFTLRSAKTGRRFTYQVNASDDGRVHFVRVLTGPENTTDYTYLGNFRGPDFWHDRKERISRDAPSAKAFAYFATCLKRGVLPDALEFFHDGHCAACGRALTDPESVAIGLGPVCRGRHSIICEAA